MCLWACVRLRGADASTLLLVAEQTSVHTDIVTSVSFSPYGTRIASGSHDASVKLWGGRASLTFAVPSRGVCRAYM